jgi:hypothetical protein
MFSHHLHALIDPFNLVVQIMFSDHLHVLCVVESSANAKTYPNHVFTSSSCVTAVCDSEHLVQLWNTTIINTIHINISCYDTIIYIAYLYLNIVHSSADSIISSYSSISLNIISHFYSTDTLNAQIKPIHKTPVAL